MTFSQRLLSSWPFRDVLTPLWYRCSSVCHHQPCLVDGRKINIVIDIKMCTELFESLNNMLHRNIFHKVVNFLFVHHCCLIHHLFTLVWHEFLWQVFPKIPFVIDNLLYGWKYEGITKVNHYNITLKSSMIVEKVYDGLISIVR